MKKMRKLLRENVEQGDLKRLVHNSLHIDEYKSKMGADEDIIVLSFKVRGKHPSNDLINFFEKGYDWVLDADVSAGEREDGDYLVFVELERKETASDNILKLIQDLINLTEQQISDWNFTYYKDTTKHSLSKENIEQIVPLSKQDYIDRYDQKEIDQLKTAAGVDVTTKAPVNDFTESLRIAAGLK
jgi:hypothetical protein